MSQEPSPTQGREIATRPDHEEPALRDRVYAVPFQRVWSEAVHLVNRRSPRWGLVEADDDEGLIRVEVTASLLGTPAEIEIRVGLDANAQTWVRMRSATRSGRWDMGVNVRRVTGFLRALDRALGSPVQSLPSPSRTAVAEPSGDSDQG